jgi:adenylyltransferase/sulfurtransferase
MNFTDDEIQRYSRQLILPEIGGKGQKKIRNARLFLVGAGGLGSPAALYLVAGGLGKLGLIDSDAVDLSNLQRQVLHTTKSVSQPKVESAKARLNAINPDCVIETYQKKLDASNISDLISGYDIVLETAHHDQSLRRQPSLLPVSFPGTSAGRSCDELPGGGRARRAGRDDGRASGHRGV